MRLVTRSYSPLNSCLRLHEEQKGPQCDTRNRCRACRETLEVWEGRLTRRSGVGGKSFFFVKATENVSALATLKETHQLFWRL